MAQALNHALEAIYKEQSGWAVPDARLRAAVRRVILQDFLPPYEHFWTSYAHTEFTTNRSKCVGGWLGGWGGWAVVWGGGQAVDWSGWAVETFAVKESLLGTCRFNVTFRLAHSPDYCCPATDTCFMFCTAPAVGRYVRLSPRDVEAMVSHDLFEGRPMSISLAKTKGSGGLGASVSLATTPGAELASYHTRFCCFRSIVSSAYSCFVVAVDMPERRHATARSSCTVTAMITSAHAHHAMTQFGTPPKCPSQLNLCFHSSSSAAHAVRRTPCDTLHLLQAERTMSHMHSAAGANSVVGRPERASPSKLKAHARIPSMDDDDDEEEESEAVEVTHRSRSRAR